MPEDPGVVRKEEEMREHEREARERSHEEGGDDDSLGTPDGDATPAPPGNIGGNLGGAS